MIRTLVAVAPVGMVFAPGSTGRQDPYPSRPVTIVTPFPPGGVTDLTARALGPVLERVVKQPIPVSAKPGAAVAVGRQSVAIAKPDGYTIMVDLVSFTMVPVVDQLFDRQPTYTLDQFVPIARLTNDFPILVVNAQNPWKSAQELVAELKKRPGELTFASSGPYGASHVPMEWFLQAAGGLKMRHLPTTGGGPATTAVLGNHAQMWVSPTGISSAHIKSGKLRPLATFAAARHPRFPELPTMKELGYDIEYYFWTGLFAPKNTPAAAIKVLRDAVRQAVQDPDFKNPIDKADTEVAYLDADDFKKFVEADAARVGAVIKRIGRVEAK